MYTMLTYNIPTVFESVESSTTKNDLTSSRRLSKEGVGRAIERASAMNQVAPETAAGGEEEFFCCSDLDKKDNDAFVEWWANRVVILDLNSALAEAGRTTWTCLPSLTGPAPGEVEGVYPTNTQHFLNALHSANLMLQKDTQCFKLIVQADDQVRVRSYLRVPLHVCVCVCVCVLQCVCVLGVHAHLGGG